MVHFVDRFVHHSLPEREMICCRVCGSLSSKFTTFVTFMYNKYSRNYSVNRFVLSQHRINILQYADRIIIEAKATTT